MRCSNLASRAHSQIDRGPREISLAADMAVIEDLKKERAETGSLLFFCGDKAPSEDRSESCGVMSPWKAQMETEVQCSNAYGKIAAMSDRGVVKARSNTRLEARARSRRPGRGSDSNTADRDEAIPEQWIARLNHALKNMADRGELNRNPLSRLRYVQRVAEERFRGQILPHGAALRWIILFCVGRICEQVGNDIHAYSLLRLSNKHLSNRR